MVEAKEATMGESIIDSLAEGGDPEAQYSLGVMYELGESRPQNHARAVRWYYQAARQGDTGAQHGLQRFAEGGDVDAQSLLGLMYEFGYGVPQSYGEAVKWYRMAAEQDCNPAMVCLASMYKQGKGAPQNGVEAAEWYRKAAEQGFALAQLELGVMYAEGGGVPQNDVQAHAWFNIAAAQDVSLGAKEHRDNVASRMTREEVARAQNLAQQYWESHVLPFQD